MYDLLQLHHFAVGSEDEHEVAQLKVSNATASISSFPHSRLYFFYPGEIRLKFFQASVKPQHLTVKQIMLLASSTAKFGFNMTITYLS